MEPTDETDVTLVRLTEALDPDPKAAKRPRQRISKKREAVLRARRDRQAQAAVKAELPTDLTRVFREITPQARANAPVATKGAAVADVRPANVLPRDAVKSAVGQPAKPKGKPGGDGPKVVYIPPPTVGGARARSRHWGLMLSFFLLVLAPFCVAGWYLYEQAVDQFASTMGFSVRKEEQGSSLDGLTPFLGDITGQSSSDTDVIYEFIQSQDLVQKIDDRLDLRAIFTKPANDPVFALQADASIEDLVAYWQRMVTIFYDAGSGLMEVRVLAFDPTDAKTINAAVFDESSTMINDLSAIARENSIRYARDDLEKAVATLSNARAALTQFRIQENIVSPEELLQRDSVLLTGLGQQLAEAEIELQLLLQNSREGDPRVRQAEQRIQVIEDKIAEERAEFGSGDQALARIVGDYESLELTSQFAQQAYVAAQAKYDTALAEASRQTLYLAPHIRPTFAETPEYPQRATLLGLLGLMLLLGWAIGAMLYYSIKDRR